MNKSLEYGKEIIEMLQSQNIELDIKVANTINLMVFEAFEKGKKQGEKEGI